MKKIQIITLKMHLLRGSGVGRFLLFFYILFTSCNDKIGEKRYYYVSNENDNELLSLDTTGINLSFTTICYPEDKSFTIDGSIRKNGKSKLNYLDFEIEKSIPDSITLIKYKPLQVYHFNNIDLLIKEVNLEGDSLMNVTFFINKWDIKKNSLNLKLNLGVVTEDGSNVKIDTIFSLKRTTVFHNH